MAGASSTSKWVQTIQESAGILVRKAKQISEPLYIRISDLFAQHGNAQLIALAQDIKELEMQQNALLEEMNGLLLAIKVQIDEAMGEEIYGCEELEDC